MSTTQQPISGFTHAARYKQCNVTVQDNEQYDLSTLILC